MPLWARNSSIGIRVREQQAVAEPVILRFASDTFMDELLEALAYSPARLSDWIAQPETWRRPMPAPRPILKPGPDSTIAHLFNRTKQLTREQAKTPKKNSKKSLDDLPAAPVSGTINSDDIPLKLFQAGHQRFYLVCASLISQEPGYPDCVLDLSRNERTTFVVRRLAPSPDQTSPGQTAPGQTAPEQADAGQSAAEPFENWKDSADEYAFVESSGGPRWQKIGAYNTAVTKQLVPGEEQMPLFPVTYLDSCGRNRQLHSGLIPVGKRETWIGAPAGNPIDSQDPRNPMALDHGSVSLTKTMLQNDVIAPWKALIEQAQFAQDNLQKSAPSYFELDQEMLDQDKDRMLRTLRDQIQTGSWYVLLDFAVFLEENLPQVWQAIKTDAAIESLDEDAGDARELLQIIQDTRVLQPLRNALVRAPHPDYGAAAVKDNLASALAAVRELEDDRESGDNPLETVEKSFVRFDEDGGVLPVDPEWPDFLFPLADPEFSLADSDYPAPVPPTTIDPGDFDHLSETDRIQAEILAKIDALADLIAGAMQLPAETEDSAAAQSLFSQTDAWFVARCVYERPQCGPIFPALVSAPTTVFQMAPFFDPDAPVRSVRISMPLDISPAGLRKYKKNAAFVISDLLCGQIKRIRKLTLADLVLSVLPWPFHKDLPDPGKTGPCGDDGGSFGMICSLSIPIVTLCALILLIIIVALFDYFFKWIPYLFVCLPIPGLKGKGK